MKNPFEVMILLTRLRDFTLNRKILDQSDMNDENNELMVEDCKKSLRRSSEDFNAWQLRKMQEEEINH